MSEYDDPAYPADSGSGRNGGADRDPSAPGPSGALRGVGVVVVAVVIGALLMPSATRGPLIVTTAAQSIPTTTTSSGSSSGSSSTVARGAGTTTTQATIGGGASLIHVLVANGTTVTNLAGGTSAYLRSRGFTTLPALDANTKVTGSLVYAGSGERSAAATVASALGLPSNEIQPVSAVPPVASTAGATVVVVAGPDLARLAPGSTTSSTGTPTG